MMQFALLSGPPDVTGTRLIADLSRKTTALTVATNEHGMAELQASIDEPSLAAQFRIADRQGLPWAYVGDGSAPGVYVGRLEDVSIAGAGLELGAFGAYRAFSDVPYSAVWVDTDVSAWQPVTPSQQAARFADRFDMDTTDHVYIAPKKGTDYDNSFAGAQSYATPDGSARDLVYVAFSFASVLPSATWRAQLLSWNRDFTSATVLWTQDGTTALTNYTVGPFTGKPRLTLELIYNTAATSTYAGENGEYYAQWTNVRVASVSGSLPRSEDIATLLVPYVTGINSGMLSSVTRISATGLDLYREVYEDQTPADILDRLARLGDTSGRAWRAWVGADRVLTFEPWGASGRTWYVDVTDLQVQRTLETLSNSVYAVYQDASGDALRSAAADNTLSQARYGLTRRQAYGARTTSATQAAYERDTRLADTATPPARAGITFDAVYTASGARVPLWSVRAGDTFILRNLAPSLSVDVDKLRVIRIGRTVWDVVANTLSIEPQVPLPTLETLLAQRENANAR